MNMINVKTMKIKYRVQHRRFQSNAIERKRPNSKWEVFIELGKNVHKSEGDEIIKQFFAKLLFNYNSDEEHDIVDLIDRAIVNNILMPMLSEMIIQARLKGLTDQQIFTPGNLVYLAKEVFNNFHNYNNKNKKNG